MQRQKYVPVPFTKLNINPVSQCPTPQPALPMACPDSAQATSAYTITGELPKREGREGLAVETVIGTYYVRGWKLFSINGGERHCFHRKVCRIIDACFLKAKIKIPP